MVKPVPNPDVPDFGGPSPQDPQTTPAFTYASERFTARQFSMQRRRELMGQMKDQELQTFEDILEAILTEESFERLNAMDQEIPIPPETLSEITMWLTRRTFGVSLDPKPSEPSPGRRRTGRKRTTG